MAIISRSQELKQLVPGLKAIIGLMYKGFALEHKDLVELDTSERSFEEELKISGFTAAPVKAEGAGVAYASAQEAWTARYVHETVALAFGITEEAMDDNLYVSASKRYTQALARAMYYTKEVKAADLYNRGFTGSGNPTYGDGKVLFATDHPLVNGGTNSNRPTTGVDLSETALEAMYIALGNWTDEQGLLINAQPEKLIIPKDYVFTARRLLFSELRPGTMNNDINAVKNLNILPGGAVVNHYLTDTNAWFVKTNVPNGAKLFQRKALKTSMDGDFDTGNVRYKAVERYAVGVTDPLGIYGSPGSS